MAVWARSTDGTSTKIRVTAMREKPRTDTLTDFEFPSGPVYSVEWTGITSTTAAITSPLEIPINIKDPNTGGCWLVIELGYKCASWGIARLMEGPR